MQKLESRKKVTVKGKVLGGEKVLSCIPMVSKTMDALLEDTKTIAALKPDGIEWRIDSFEGAGDAEASVAALKAIHPLVSDIVVIFTLRHKAEGGAQDLTQEQRLATIKACVETGLVDVVDFELNSNTPEEIQTVRQLCTDNGTALILSAHNFKETPSEEDIMATLEAEQAAGADICKFAVMPKDFDDVLSLMRATYRSRMGKIEGPIITMSMSETGKITRVIGDSYGSDLSFVLGTEASAPGQIPVKVINQLWDLLK
ncbi:MAG: type I 3-dehydroquinate dehydratase [Lachnospiraceae bacterium]|nr:type I 3-dehydroquinate dehydratase [Lachnospiraceae bacterium]